MKCLLILIFGCSLSACSRGAPGFVGQSSDTSEIIDTETIDTETESNLIDSETEILDSDSASQDTDSASNSDDLDSDSNSDHLDTESETATDTESESDTETETTLVCPWICKEEKEFEEHFTCEEYDYPENTPSLIHNYLLRCANPDDYCCQPVEATEHPFAAKSYCNGGNGVCTLHSDDCDPTVPYVDYFQYCYSANTVCCVPSL